jgi:glycosyltransferase involved in cell wall biosynthesis
MKNIKSSHGKPRLIFILEYASVTGGMVHSVTSLIKEITADFEILVICPNGQLSLTLAELGVTVFKLADVSLWHTKNPIKRVLLFYKVNNLIKQHLVPNTIVITNNVYAQFIVALCSYLLPFKTVYFNRGGDLSNKISKLIILLSNNLHLVFATSTSQQSIVKKSGLLNKGAHCQVLFNPIEKLSLKYDNSLKNSKFFTLGIVGYIDEGKNQLLALESMCLLISKGHSVQLCIYGEANNKVYLQHLNEKIKQLNLADFVKFQGFVKDKTKIYSEIDLLLSTSLSEGFGRTLVEAMLEKKPVVALHCAGGPKDIITSEKYGKLVDNDANSVANAIEHFITDPMYTEQVINDAFHYASNTFNPKIIAQQFISTIKKEVL